MRNIALFLTYLGTDYHGWQVQKNLPTVAETVEKAAAMIVGHPVHVTGCGRTDAGVHARCYVANFRTTSTIPVDRLPYAMNTHLPCDIVVTKAFEVHENFNAIGSCSRKEYTYQIYNSRLKDPFYVNRAWFYPKHLDEKIMQEAASQFVGTHDFAAFQAAGGTAKTTIRTLEDVQLSKAGDELTLIVKGNAFLYNMVRIIAGTMLDIGMGRIPEDAFRPALETGDRLALGITAPACGLELTQVFYQQPLIGQTLFGMVK